MTPYKHRTVRVRCSRTSKVSITYRRQQSCRNQESFGRTVPSSADASEDNDVRDAGKLKPIARIFQLHFCSRFYGYSFSQFNVVGCESYHFGQITQNNDLEMEWDYSGRKGKDGQQGLSELLLTCTWSIQWWHLVEQQAEGTEWMSWHNWLASQS